MLLAAVLLLASQQAERTPAVYRCPRAEGETARMQELIKEDIFDTVCIDPTAGPSATKWAKGKVRILVPSKLDTKANMKWRQATMEFAMGKISPKAWLAKTKGIGETFHFLTSPKTKGLRDEMSVIPVDPGRTYSGRSVFAEMVLLSWPGVPCLYASDTWATRDLPDAGRLQSWVLAMHDYLGPMLQYRHDAPAMVTGKPEIVRADDTPGLLVFRHMGKGHRRTFYLNNSFAPIALPPLAMAFVTINIGLNVDGEKPVLMDGGFLIEDVVE